MGTFGRKRLDTESSAQAAHAKGMGIFLSVEEQSVPKSDILENPITVEKEIETQQLASGATGLPFSSPNSSEQGESKNKNRKSPALIDFRDVVYTSLMSRIDVAAAAKLSSVELLSEMELFVASFANEQRYQLNEREQKQVAKEIVDDMVGFGPLELLLDDDTVTDIMVNGPNEVFVERAGKLQKTAVRFRDAAHLSQIAQRIANRVGRRVDESSPMVDARLEDGSRVNIIVPPVSLEGITLSIRKFSKRSITLELMAQQGNMSKAMAQVLQIAATCRLNILVSGGTGSGKTTLLNALSQMIDPQERIVTIEDAAELQLQQPHVVRLESRPENTEGEGEVTIRDLLKNALRMRPDRIIVGEVRGSETLDMLQAMNTGHDGSMSTIHSNRAREAVTRLENMVAMTGLGLPGNFVRTQISNAIQGIIQVERMRDGIRRITEITEITGMEGEVISMRELFKYEYNGEDTHGFLVGTFNCLGGRPHFINRAAYYGLDKNLIVAMQSDGVSDEIEF